MKKLYVLLASLLLVVFISACGEGTQTTQNNKPTVGGSDEGVTAMQAWEKVKPEADKWSSSYKIASISEDTSGGFQRIDGKAIGWEFYLEECTEEYDSSSLAGLCKKGKTKKFSYRCDKQKVTALEEQSMTSGRNTFSVDEFKIDSDKAQDIARKEAGVDKIDSEEFVMRADSVNDVPCWEVRRQCYYKADDDECSKEDNYFMYVNITTGEAYEDKSDL